VNVSQRFSIPRDRNGEVIKDTINTTLNEVVIGIVALDIFVFLFDLILPIIPTRGDTKQSGNIKYHHTPYEYIPSKAMTIPLNKTNAPNNKMGISLLLLANL
jgi:hypothetical protein